MRTGKGKRKRERMFCKHAVGAPSSNWCWGWPGQSGWVSRRGVSAARPGWGGPGEREWVPGQGSHVQRQGVPGKVMLPEPRASFALELRSSDSPKLWKTALSSRDTQHWQLVVTSLASDASIAELASLPVVRRCQCIYGNFPSLSFN